MLSNAKHPRAIIALVVVMVIAIAAVWAFESSGALDGPSGNPRTQIQEDFSSHLDNIHTMNLTAIEGDYTSGASVQFADPLENTGNYTGLKQIGIAYGADVFVNFAVPRFSNINSTIKVERTSATLDSTFVVVGYDADDYAQSASVSAHLVYAFHGGAWLISYEFWRIDFANGSGNNSGD